MYAKVGKLANGVLRDLYLWLTLYCSNQQILEKKQKADQLDAKYVRKLSNYYRVHPENIMFAHLPALEASQNITQRLLYFQQLTKSAVSLLTST